LRRKIAEKIPPYYQANVSPEVLVTSKFTETAFACREMSPYSLRNATAATLGDLNGIKQDRSDYSSSDAADNCRPSHSQFSGNPGQREGACRLQKSVSLEKLTVFLNSNLEKYQYFSMLKNF
jgi:hypothetical protein